MFILKQSTRRSLHETVVRARFDSTQLPSFYFLAQLRISRVGIMNENLG